MAVSRLCSILGCGKRHLARGWCRAHYLRWFRHGDPLAGGTFYGEAQEYYRTVVLAHNADVCLFWPYGTNAYGYPMMGGKYVNRLVCEEEHGPPPSENLDAAHSCGKGAQGCVARRHVSWKTRSGNHADKVLHGTDSRGERSSSAKLTRRDVLHIRKINGTLSQRAIAEQYGIDQSTVSDIVRRKSWFWLD
ncbi:Lrp/AsnC family transcriptional regulator [Mesorhizobium sp. B2-6-3]|uniref:winged helix-turn-helix domain-containing protein n=1 Tax=Mesorhizobium sp. B2-6-3 TaxID=2589914 RepID=UPI00112D4D78|nr:Lrp/AsnC family transcriptional regulator [Mesorhizobium sp. B2-6-3]TPJ76889.1 Lrp/AsnC family transcriptional regulator [Mesorhizobium sp. B2-6-3]